MGIVNEITNYLDPIDEDILNEITNKEIRQILIITVKRLKVIGVDLDRAQQKQFILMLKKDLSDIQVSKKFGAFE